VSAPSLAVRPGGRLLVVKTSSLGDVIHATPCLKALRSAFPAARIVMAVDRAFAAAVAHNPNLDELVETRMSLRGPLRLPWAALLRLWRGARFDAALDLQGTRGSAALVYASRARWQGGRGSVRPGWQLACRPDLGRHAVEVCAEVTAAAGVAVAELEPRVFLAETDERALVATLRGRGLPVGGFVVVSPFSRWASKEWPRERWAKLIVALREREPVTVLLAGDRSEVSGAERLLALLPDGAAASLVGALPLAQALCLYRRARLLVAGDCGPLHAAAAVGTQVVALFGPTLPERTGPWGAGHLVVQKARPASHHAYRTDREGRHIGAIDVDTALSAVLSALAATSRGQVSTPPLAERQRS
jgi:heptosyltransferase I